MRSWWSDRSQRERAALGGVALVTLLFALFQFGLKPLVSMHRSAAAAYASAAALLADVEAGAVQIQALQAGTRIRSDVPARTAVSAVAAEQGLTLTRLQPLEKGDLDVWLDDVSSPALFTWLGALSDRHGIAVVRAQIQRNDGGTVRAQITLAGAP
jgi:type II secretory pathway component PulM